MKKSLFHFALLVGLSAAWAQAQSPVVISSTGQGDTRTAIAVPTFAAADPAMATVAREMAQVIADDLTFNGLFRVLTPERYPAGFTALPADIQQLDFDAWAATGAVNLVHGVVSSEGGGIVAQFRLFDLRAKNQLLGQELRVERNLPRLAAHRFSEEVIKQVDGVAGIGSTEIFFCGGPTGKKEIYVADYDGANMRPLTKHGSISIKPKVSPDGNRIAYVSYKDRYNYLYIFDRRTGASMPLSKEVGLNSAPSWAPDGNRIAMTLSKDGNNEIYLRDPDGRNPRRLTNGKDLDTSPCFSPDGSRMAFVSDRGTPQIFVMNADGSGQTRLSLQGGKSYDPAWSPDGKSIAYVVEQRGQGFQIYVMNADGTNARQLTNSGGANESPAWSPDSRHIMFGSTRNGRSELFAVNVATLEEIRIPRLNIACEGPAWGPRRQ